MVEFIDGVKSQNSFLLVILSIVLCVIVTIAIAVTIKVDSLKDVCFAIFLWILGTFMLYELLTTFVNSYPTISLNGEKFKVTHKQYSIYKLKYEDILKNNNGDKEKSYTVFLEEFLKEMK